jgi:Tfp pilus assembly PilM family ATPase
MIGKFVGIDLDSSKIRLCVIKRTLRKSEIVKLYEIDSSQSDNPAKLISGYLSENNIKTDVAVSLPESPVSLRALSFPFKDINKINQVYNFELENVSTLDIEDKIHSFHIVENTDGAEALVCMYRKDEVKNILDMFETVSVSPKVVTYSPFSLSEIYDKLNIESPIVIISIGQFTTNFSLFSDTGLKRVRSSTQGLESIIKKYSVLSGEDYSSALIKVKRGFSSSEDKIIYNSFSSIFSEMKKTIQFFEFDLKQNMQNIIISGEVALLPGIIEVISNEINRKVSVINLPELGKENSANFLNSYALALYGSQSSKGKLNFRKGEFSFKAEDEDLRKALLVPVLLVCMLFCLVLIRNTVNYIRLNNKVAKLEKQISSEVKEIFPDIKVIPQPMEFMLGQVSKLNEELSTVSSIKSGKTPLDLIRSISVSMPRVTSVAINEINFIDNQSLRLIGTSGSYDDIAKIEKALSDNSYFQNVVRQSTGSALDKIRFEISMEVK